MHLTIIQIGKTKHSFFQEAEEEYRKRLRSYATLNIITLKEHSVKAGAEEKAREISKNKEGEEILKHLPDNYFVVALDEHGKKMSSLQFADFLKNKRDLEGGKVVLLIGGPYGLSREVLGRADAILSFSDFTFTHELIRVLLLEQLYRAFTILQNKTYHY